MKTLIKKIIVISLILITLFNIVSVSMATDVSAEELMQQHEEQNGLLAGIVKLIVEAISGLCLWIGDVFNTINQAIALSDGASSTVGAFVTPFDVIFNKLSITDINIFKFEAINPDSIVATISKSVAMFTMVCQAFAFIALTVVGSYMLIKTAASGLAEQKAIGKKGLLGFAKSCGMLVLLDFGILFVIYILDFFVEGFSSALTVDTTAAMSAIYNKGSEGGNLLSITCALVYLIMGVMTSVLIYKYIVRYLKVSLLIIIAPLTIVPYPIHQTNATRQTEFSNWTREFMYQIMTQIIHIIIYIFLIGNIFKVLAETVVEISGPESLGICVMAVLSIAFINPAERMIRDIFGLPQTSSPVSKTVKNVVTGVGVVASTIRHRNDPVEAAGGVLGGYRPARNNSFNGQDNFSKPRFGKPTSAETSKPTGTATSKPTGTSDDLEKAPVEEESIMVAIGTTKTGEGAKAEEEARRKAEEEARRKAEEGERIENNRKTRKNNREDGLANHEKNQEKGRDRLVETAVRDATYLAQGKGYDANQTEELQKQIKNMFENAKKEMENSTPKNRGKTANRLKLQMAEQLKPFEGKTHYSKISKEFDEYLEILKKENTSQARKRKVKKSQGTSNNDGKKQNNGNNKKDSQAQTTSQGTPNNEKRQNKENKEAQGGDSTRKTDEKKTSVETSVKVVMERFDLPKGQINKANIESQLNKMYYQIKEMASQAGKEGKTETFEFLSDCLDGAPNDHEGVQLISLEKDPTVAYEKINALIDEINAKVGNSSSTNDALNELKGLREKAGGNK